MMTGPPPLPWDYPRTREAGNRTAPRRRTPPTRLRHRRWRQRRHFGRHRGLEGRFGLGGVGVLRQFDRVELRLVGAIALIVSLLVTVAYHLGYPEYRAAGGVAGPSIGNGVISLGYLLTNNPIAAVFSHIAMHIAGVLHGPSTVMQLPPHY